MLMILFTKVVSFNLLVSLSSLECFNAKRILLEKNYRRRQLPSKIDGRSRLFPKLRQTSNELIAPYTIQLFGGSLTKLTAAQIPEFETIMGEIALGDGAPESLSAQCVFSSQQNLRFRRSRQDLRKRSRPTNPSPTPSGNRSLASLSNYIEIKKIEEEFREAEAEFARRNNTLVSEYRRLQECMQTINVSLTIYFQLTWSSTASDILNDYKEQHEDNMESSAGKNRLVADLQSKGICAVSVRGYRAESMSTSIPLSSAPTEPSLNSTVSPTLSSIGNVTTSTPSVMISSPTSDNSTSLLPQSNGPTISFVSNVPSPSAGNLTSMPQSIKPTGSGSTVVGPVPPTTDGTNTTFGSMPPTVSSMISSSKEPSSSENVTSQITNLPTLSFGSGSSAPGPSNSNNSTIETTLPISMPPTLSLGGGSSNETSPTSNSPTVSAFSGSSIPVEDNGSSEGTTNAFPTFSVVNITSAAPTLSPGNSSPL